MASKAMKAGFFITALAVVAFISIAIAVVHVSTTETADVGVLPELKGVTVCLECHDPGQTIGFHYPDKVMGIEEKKGLRRRICVDCHGPLGTDPDRQMTDSSAVIWQEKENYFRVKSEVVHAIHLKKLESEVMICETCHLIKEGDPTQVGEFIILPKPASGQILVCQMCHLPGNPGNYISVHVTSGHQECTTCHTGDLKEVHKRSTGKLG